MGEEEANLVAAMAVKLDCGKRIELLRQAGILQGDTFFQARGTSTGPASLSLWLGISPASTGSPIAVRHEFEHAWYLREMLVMATSCNIGADAAPTVVVMAARVFAKSLRRKRVNAECISDTRSLFYHTRCPRHSVKFPYLPGGGFQMGSQASIDLTPEPKTLDRGFLFLFHSHLYF